ncbi:MAG: hypothetical protein R3F59_18725 [Myxococcota bacterium]
MIRPTLRMLGAVIRDGVRRAPLVGWLGTAVLLAVLLAALLSPLAGYPVGADVTTARSEAPSAAHWLGTDHLGRDVFWRLLLASRAFVGPGSLACAVAAGLGVPIGALAGWWTGPASQALRGALGAVAAIPALVLVVLGCARFGTGPV